MDDNSRESSSSAPDGPVDWYASAETLVGPTETLRNGIWPASAAIWAIIIYMGLFLIRPWEILFPWMAVIPIERVYAIGMLAVVISTRGLNISGDRQNVSVILFMFSLVISGVFAWRSDLAFASGGELYVYATLFVFYLILVSTIRTPYELVFVVASYIAIEGAYLAKCNWEFFVHGAGRTSMGVLRMVGVSQMFGHPNALAAFTVISLPFWYFLLRGRELISQTWPEFWQIWFRRGLYLYPVLAVSSVVFTNSRGGMLSLILFAGLIVLRSGSIRRMFWLAAAIAVIAAIIWSKMDEQSKGRFRSIWDSSASTESARISAEGRAAGLRAGMTMFSRFPITGVGAGNFIAYRVHFVDGINLAAHHIVGQALGTFGIIGATCFLMMALCTYLNHRRIQQLAIQSDDSIVTLMSSLSIAIRNSLVIAFFCGLTNHNLLWFNWLWCAAFSALAERFCTSRHVQP